MFPDDGPWGTETSMSHIKRYFKIQIITFYVLINIAFVGKNSFVLIKMHGKTTIKIKLDVFIRIVILYTLQCTYKSTWKVHILLFRFVPDSTVAVRVTMDDFIQSNVNCMLKMNQTNPKSKMFNYSYCEVHNTQFHRDRSRSLGDVTYVRTSKVYVPSYNWLTNVTLKHR